MNYTKTLQSKPKTIRPYLDNIDVITKSLSDRLGLGRNSLLGAHQVRVATMHMDQMTDIPKHLRQISLGEEIESTSYEETEIETLFHK